MTHEETHEEMVEGYSDFYKDVHGFRPRFEFFRMTAAELQADYDFFSKQIELNNKLDEEREIEAIDHFRDLIADCLECGAESEDQAITWLFEGENQTDINCQDVEHWIWELGFLFTDYGRHLVKRVQCLVDMHMVIE